VSPKNFSPNPKRVSLRPNSGTPIFDPDWPLGNREPSGGGTPTPTPTPTSVRQYLSWDKTTGATKDYWNEHLGLRWENELGDWSDANGDSQGSVPYATAPSGATTGAWIEIDVTTLVQADTENKGFYLRHATSSGVCDYWGRLTDDAPELIINGDTYAECLATAGMYDSTSTNLDTSDKFQLSTSSAAVIQFEYPNVEVTSATLRLRVEDKRSSGTTTVQVFMARPPTFTFGGENPVAGSDPTVIHEMDWTEYTVPDTAEVLDGGARLRNKFESIDGEDTRLSLSRIVWLMEGDETDAGRPPISTLDEAYVRMHVLLEDDFTSTVDGNKAAIGWDLRGGYWVDDGYWQSTTGNGGSPGTGLKVWNSDKGQWEYQGHSIRMEFGKAADDGNPYAAYRPVQSYVYHLDQAGLFGSIARLGAGIIRVGEWFTIEQRIKLNSITGPYDANGNGEAVADGIMQTWLNGDLVQTKTDYRWRRHPEMGIFGMWHNWFFGGVSSPDKEMHYQIANSITADGYIGAEGQPSIWPAWRDNMLAQTWAAIPATNTLEDLDPSNDPAINPDYPSDAPWKPGTFSRIVSAWCGAAFNQAECTLGIPIAGGHGDYYGNEGYSIKLDVDAPEWRRLRGPSGAIGNPVTFGDGQESTGLYSDGRVRATHTYSTLVHIPGLGWGVTQHGACSVTATSPNGRPLFIDEETGELLYRGTNESVISDEANGCYDPVRHCLWVHERGGSQIKQYDIDADSWSVGSSFGSSSGPAQLTYLDGEDLIFVRRGNSTWAIFDPSDRSLTTITSSGSGILDSTAQDAQPAWCEADRSIYLWDNSTDTDKLTKIAAPADPKTGTWVVSTVTPDAANTVTPTAKVGNGTYGRFGYSQKLDGFYLLNGVDEPIYFFARTD
jgi:hypothetical protein